MGPLAALGLPVEGRTENDGAAGGFDGGKAEETAMPDLEQDADSQDLAEVFDETNTTEDGGDIAHPDVALDVYDVTAADDDSDEDQPSDPGDFDPDTLDESDREAMLEEDDGVDDDSDDDASPGDPADAVLDGDGSPADFQTGRAAPRRR